MPAAWHLVEQYANNRIEADHSRLEHRRRPMRGVRTDRTALSPSSGLDVHAVQPLRVEQGELASPVTPRPPQGRRWLRPHSHRWFLTNASVNGQRSVYRAVDRNGGHRLAGLPAFDELVRQRGTRTRVLLAASILWATRVRHRRCGRRTSSRLLVFGSPSRGQTDVVQLRSG